MKSKGFTSRVLRSSAAWTVVFALIFCSSLMAFNVGELNFYITDESLFNYNKKANKEAQFYNALSVFANYKKWSAGLTMRAFNFYKQMPNATLTDPKFELYRAYVEYNSKHLKVSAGDFYSLLGRGMVLSVLKNEDVYRDRTITGGNIHYNKGRFDIKFLGGIIKDETGNQDWYVTGGETSYEYAKNHTIGAHFSFIDEKAANMELGGRLTYSMSLRGNKLFKNFSYYTEFAMLSFADSSIDNGYGLYSNITYSKSHFTGFLEFKRYKDFNNQMNNPPVGDRVDEIATLIDTTGIRLYAQYSFFDPDIILFVNFGRYEEFGKAGNHIYGGFTAEDLWDRFTINASYGVRDIAYPVKKWETNLTYQFSDTWSVEMGMKDKRYEDLNFIFKEIDHNFQVSYSPYVSVFFLHQYSHNKIMDLNHFYSGGVKVYLPGGTAIELSGGTIRGGQVCSGGQCFMAPPFKGVKFSLLHTFK